VPIDAVSGISPPSHDCSAVADHYVLLLINPPVGSQIPRRPFRIWHSGARLDSCSIPAEPPPPAVIRATTIHCEHDIGVAQVVVKGSPYSHSVAKHLSPEGERSGPTTMVTQGHLSSVVTDGAFDKSRALCRLRQGLQPKYQVIASRAQACSPVDKLDPAGHTNCSKHGPQDTPPPLEKFEAAIANSTVWHIRSQAPVGPQARSADLAGTSTISCLDHDLRATQSGNDKFDADLIWTCAAVPTNNDRNSVLSTRR